MGVGTRLARVVNAMEALMVPVDRQGLVYIAEGGLQEKVRTSRMELGVKCSC